MGLTNKKTNGSDNKNQIQQPQQNSNSAASAPNDTLDSVLNATGVGEPFSPSFVAIESILSISTSNPGVAGDINPFA